MTMLHVPAIHKRAEENIHKWINSEHARHRLATQQVKESVGPYLLVSRETGAGGSEIARQAGLELNWDVLDQEIIDYLAEEYGTPRDLVEFVDEKNSNWIGEIMTSWIDKSGVTSVSYFHRLNQLFLLAAHHGKVVIVGRGARFVLPRIRGFSVRILAPLDYRVEQIALERELNLKEARKFVLESDRKREAFIKEHFHCQAADPHMYDLVINVESLTKSAAASMIADAVRLWQESREPVAEARRVS